MKLRVMTFNIRYKNTIDGINNWDKRKNLITDIIEMYSPDIIGFQECLEEQYLYLNEHLGDYKSYGVGRDDGKREGEFNPVFYKNCHVVNKNSFWLSDTPDIPSHFDDAMFRIATWILIESLCQAVIVNTHFSVRSQKARLESIRIIHDFLSQFPPSTVKIITGDFNFTPQSSEYRRMASLFTDTYDENIFLGNKVSFHGWFGVTSHAEEDSQPALIDYIWADGNYKEGISLILADNGAYKDGVYPSDHWPVLLEMDL